MTFFNTRVKASLYVSFTYLLQELLFMAVTGYVPTVGTNIIFVTLAIVFGYIMTADFLASLIVGVYLIMILGKSFQGDIIGSIILTWLIVIATKKNRVELIQYFLEIVPMGLSVIGRMITMRFYEKKTIEEK